MGNECYKHIGQATHCTTAHECGLDADAGCVRIPKSPCGLKGE